MGTHNIGERGKVVAWMTEDGERCVTARTMAGARKDGGAMLSSLSAYVVPLTYAHPPAAAGRATELEAQLAASDRHGVYLEELTDAQADRIAALEAQLAETKKAYRSMVDANREASEKLTASREREGRMREAAKLGARWANEYASQMSGYAISEDATEDAEAIEAAVGEPITAQANQSFPASLAAALIDAGWVRIEYDEQTERLEALILKTVCEARAALAADKEGK